MADSPNRSSLRRIWRSVFANRSAADDSLDAIAELQAQLNALTAKLDGDTGVTDTDYEADLAVTELDPDATR